jgi:hypothetical protein
MVHGPLYTTVYFLSNLQVRPISWSVCSWMAFPALCNVTLLFGPFVSYKENEVL